MLEKEEESRTTAAIAREMPSLVLPLATEASTSRIKDVVTFRPIDYLFNPHFSSDFSPTTKLNSLRAALRMDVAFLELLIEFGVNVNFEELERRLEKMLSRAGLERFKGSKGLIREVRKGLRKIRMNGVRMSW